MDPIKNPSQAESKLHFLDYWRIIRVRKTVILAVFLLVVITATLVTFILPESYASTARIKIQGDDSDITPIGDKQFMTRGGYDPYFIQTEFEVIQSKVILDKVIEQLNLNDVWAKKYGADSKLKTDETMILLKRVMDLRPVRNTSLIEIRVYSDKADEAARLANTIASVYQDYRLELSRRKTTGGIKILQDQLLEQEQKVDSVQKEVDRLRKELDISEEDAQADAPSPLIDRRTLLRLEEMRVDSERILMGKEKLLSQFTSKTPSELRAALPTALDQPDSLLNEFLAQLSMAEQTLAKQRKDYGPEHAEVLRVQAQVDDLNRKIDQRVQGILDGLKDKVASAKAEANVMTTRVSEAKDKDISKSENTRPYWIKKRELADLIQFKKLVALKLLSEKADVNLPKTAMVEIVDPATAALKPSRPNKPLNIALGVVVGLIVGIGLAFFIEYLDTSVKTIDDVERALQSPVLGVIPQNVGLLMFEGAESPHGEAYRVLRTNLLFSRKDDKLNTICVVSAGAGEGKTTTAFNLATVFAQSGNRVVLVDSDLRRPTIHKLLKIANTIGLTSYLLKQNTLDEVIQTTPLPNFDFLPSGKLPSSSLGILSSPQMKDLINELRQRYDFVVFDSPPIMGVSDASVLASEVDMTVQVIQYRRYPQPMNIRAKQLIEKVGGRLIGIVLNNINMSQDESYYYYSGYYHDYYYSKKEDEPTPGAKPEAKPAGGDKKVEIRQKY
jgi:capsular exopolysaccharide synthesis family protein